MHHIPDQHHGKGEQKTIIKGEFNIQTITFLSLMLIQGHKGPANNGSSDQIYCL